MKLIKLCKIGIYFIEEFSDDHKNISVFVNRKKIKDTYEQAKAKIIRQQKPKFYKRPTIIKTLLSLQIEAKLKERLKSIAFEDDMTMTDIMHNALESYLERRDGNIRAAQIIKTTKELAYEYEILTYDPK